MNKWYPFARINRFNYSLLSAFILYSSSGIPLTPALKSSSIIDQHVMCCSDDAMALLLTEAKTFY